MYCKGIFSHKSDDWSTPPDIYDFFMARDYFDPCPLFAKSSFDGLSVEWKRKVFINPPYSDIGVWVDRALDHVSKRNGKVVLLLPVRTDRDWFGRIVDSYMFASVIFFKGRLKFGGSKSGAPFPSMLVFLEPGYLFASVYFGTVQFFLDGEIFNERKFL